MKVSNRMILFIVTGCVLGALVVGIYQEGQSRRRKEATATLVASGCHGLVQDAAANLERAADFAERQQDNGFERGQALGRITALRTVCAPSLTDPSPEVRRRLARLVDERLAPQELRDLARDVSLGRLVDEAP